MMLRFNQDGFGLGAMIAFLCVFLLAIIVVAVIAYHMGVGQDPGLIGYFIY